MRQLAVCLILIVFSLSPATAQQDQRRRAYPPTLSGARVETYKTIEDVKLRVWIFSPENHQSSDRRPAAVFFFGGGWRSGTPKQFEQQCRYLAKRGMVAMTADYRVSSRHGTKATACVEDGKSAVRWMRQNADRLGIDPQRIVAGGGSAGGHVAACTGVVPGFEVGATDVSSRPNAMVLFNPATVLAPVPNFEIDPEKQKALAGRMGVEPEKLSPWHQVSRGAPPTIVFHGKADKTVPFRTAEMFARKLQQLGTRCELKAYPKQGHGFFNFGRADNVMFRRTLQDLDEFLVSLGYLQREPADEGSSEK